MIVKEIVSAWIFEGNLRPLFETLSWLVGYDFEQSDWLAIRTGVIDTNQEEGKWYEYALGSSSEVEVSVASDRGSSVVHIELHCQPELKARASVALSIFQQYKVSL